MKQAVRHWSSAAVATLFLLLAAGSIQQESPEQQKKNDAEARAAVDDYAAKLGAIHTKLGGLMKGSLQPIACDAAALKRAVHNDYPRLITVSAAYLARFGADKSAWKKDDGQWAWLTDSTFRGHFEQHPGERSAYAVRDTAQRIKETFLPSRYLVVLWPDDGAANRVPVWRGDQPYEGGRFYGWMFVVDQNDASVACQAHLEVRSSSKVEYRTGGRGVVGKLREQNPETVLKDDFEDNFEAAVEKTLGDGIEVAAAWGSLFK